MFFKLKVLPVGERVVSATVAPRVDPLFLNSDSDMKLCIARAWLTIWSTLLWIVGVSAKAG